MNKVVQRIKESEKKYDVKDQRCELLFRNKKFLEEFKGPVLDEDPNEGLFFKQTKEKLLNAIKTGSLTNIQENFIIGLLKRNARVELKKLKEKSLKEIDDWLQQELKKRPRGFHSTDDENWRRFCRRWQIHFLWGRSRHPSISDLRNFIYLSPPIYYRDPKKGKYVTFVSPSDLNPADDWVLRVKDEERFIYLKIDGWTREKDIEKILPRIKKLQKEIYGYSERGKRTFGRDLCWWDLHYKDEYGKLSYGSIVDRWKTYKGKREKVSREDVRISREDVIKGIERIQEYINRLTPFPI